MGLLWNQARMQSLLFDFHSITDLRVGFFDLDGNEIIAYPATLTRYCSIIRQCKRGFQSCMSCDRIAFEQAAKYRNIYTYRCHAGLTEMIAPIMAGDSIVGYLMFGQLRSYSVAPADMEEILRRLKKIGVSTDELTEAYAELSTHDIERIKASAHILQACAAYVWMDNHFRVQDAPLEMRIRDYISQNLDKPLHLQELAASLLVGKTKLCSAVKSAYGMTIVELVRSIRMQKARELLQTSRLSIAEVSEAVGIKDYNYFTKLFKQELDVTPSRYRKLCENEYVLHAREQRV